MTNPKEGGSPTTRAEIAYIDQESIDKPLTPELAILLSHGITLPSAEELEDLAFEDLLISTGALARYQQFYKSPEERRNAIAQTLPTPQNGEPPVMSNTTNLMPSNFIHLEADKLSLVDADNLVSLKKAHDAVYDFYQRVSNDHRRIDKQDVFQAEIEKTRESIRAFMDLMTAEENVIDFFFLCSLRAIREGESDQGRYFPINIEQLEATHIKKDDVARIMAGCSDREAARLAGIFLAEGAAIDSMLQLTIEQARLGHLVTADEAFILLDHMDELALDLPGGSTEGMSALEQAQFILSKIEAAFTLDTDVLGD